MKMTLLYSMSLAGSTGIGIYLCTFFLTKRYLPIMWHKIYLTVNIFLFLMPFECFKAEYTEWLNRYLGLKTWYQEENIVKNVTHFTVFVYQDGIYISNLPVYIMLLFSLLLGIGGLIVLFKKYKTVYLNIMKGVVLYENGEMVLEELEKETKRDVKRCTKNKVYLCVGIKSPITIGILHRKIILPDIVWEETKLRDVLCHELVHIKVMDNLVKAILFLVLLLNFYNPLIYYLLYRWNLISEMYCDYKVTMKKSIQETGDYAKMIIDFAEEEGTTGLPIVGFSLGKKQIKERIFNMKNTRKKYGKISKVVGLLILVGAVFASSLTVYAYEKRQIMYFDTEPYEEVEEIFLYSNWEDSVLYHEKDTKYNEYEQYIISDNFTFFVTENGEVHYNVYTEQGEYQTYRACSHTYVSGTVTTHSKNNSGGCKVDYYDGKYCNKCGHIIRGNHIKSVLYDVCPH